MKSFGKIMVIAAVFMFAAVPLRADELDNYSAELDRVEAGFWRAMFSNTDSSRDGYRRTVANLSIIAKKIKQAEFVAGIPHNTGDLINSSSRINSMLSQQQPSYRKANITIPTLKKSNLEVYRRYVGRQQRRNSRQALVPYEELSLNEYRMFLDEVRDENIKMIGRRIQANRMINTGSKEDLIRVGESFHKYVSDLRYTVLKMRLQHKLFKKTAK